MNTAPKQPSIKQQLAQALRGLKPAPVNPEGILVGENHTIPDSTDHRKAELAHVKKHIKTKFETTVSDLVVREQMSLLAAEKIAFEHAMFRIQSWRAASQEQV